MFDGNHRSRRQVNLGGKNRRRGRETTRPAMAPPHERNSLASLPAFTAAVETGRESLLEQTRLKREERRRHQLEERSATKITRVYRGFKARQYVAGDQVLGAQWQQQRRRQEEQTTSSASPSAIKQALAELLHQESFLLSLRLSPPLLQAVPKSPPKLTVVDSWLMDHAASISLYNQAQSGTGTTKSAMMAYPYALSYRIVQMTLSRLRPLQRSNMTEPQFQGLFAILQYYLTDASLLWKRMGGAKGLLLLLQSTQECLWWHAQQKMPQYETSVQTLWIWARQAVNELDEGSALRRSAQALLAATVMGHHVGILNDPSCSWWCHYGNDNQNSSSSSSSSALYDANFVALVDQVAHRSSTADKDFSTVLNRVLHGRWHIVLANALDWQKQNTESTIVAKGGGHLPSTALLKFLHHVLTHHNDLAILTSLVVRGDDIKSAIFSHQQLTTMDDEEDDNYLEEEMEAATAVLPGGDPMGMDNANASTNNIMNQPADNTMNESSKKQKSSATRKLSKQELQTMPYLERVYQEERQKQMNATLAALSEQVKTGNSAAKAYVQSLVDMAIQIGNPSLWVSWGKLLLPQLQNEEGDSTTMGSESTTTADDDSSFSSCKVFMQLLARILQSTTGLRARTSASSPFLSQLAFAGGGTMIEGLWQAVLAHGGAEADKGSSQDMLTCTMVTVFCDIFAHSLIALSDEKFLTQYTDTKADDHGGPKKAVIAEHVIGYLRNLLYEVYWTKPVLLDDVKLASTSSIMSSEDDSLRCMRARFLLSGTKLWGSLYERFCRLGTSSFCSESAWWFPHLASQEGGNAVVSSAAQASSNVDPNGVVDMDVDEDSDDDDDSRMDQSQNDDDQNAPTQEMSAADAESDALANAFRDPKMARVLTCIPQALPFDRRVRLFDSLLTADKLKTQDENAEFRHAMLSMMRGEENEMAGGRERVEIRRDRLYDDSMRQLNRLGPKLKKKVQVSFVNQHGTAEAGIDGGGVLKEFIEDLIQDAFSSDGDKDSSDIPRLFSVTPLQTLTVNSALTQDASLLPHYEFLGRVLGKAVYESILVEPQFCLPFLNQLLGKRNSLEDLKNFDMEYYLNLRKLLALSESEIEDLGMTFELTLKDGSSMRTVELLPGGRSRQVTKQNVIQYVHLNAHQRLNVEGSIQTKSFLRGFRDLIPASWVRLFSGYELQKIISGDDSLKGFDVSSLKRSMNYAAGYNPQQPIMQWFWEVLEEFTPEQQRKFLKFMTSCSRQPLLGFDSLDPPPCIQQIRIADHIFENDAAVVAKNVPLPTSSTCMNLLKLPNYRNKDLLRKKLLDAVESGAGFELT